MSDLDPSAQAPEPLYEYTATWSISLSMKTYPQLPLPWAQLKPTIIAHGPQAGKRWENRKVLAVQPPDILRIEAKLTEGLTFVYVTCKYLSKEKPRG